MTRGTAIDLWRRLRLTRPRINNITYVASPTDAPDDIDRHTLIVVGNEQFQKWAMLECPCGRGHRLTVSLQLSHKPSWRFTIGADGPSLFPSIDSRALRRCHFWLRGGRVRWLRQFRDLKLGAAFRRRGK
jgi:hypothetical protein